VTHEGFTVRLPDGSPARLAVIDAAGHVIAAGPEVEREAWAVATTAWRNFLIGRGYMRVRTRKVGGALQGRA
jgi:hypothetical protein